ncbi:MAG TPA: HAMP domain-containing histidine kinase [Prevotellaceae bacterium]|nr:HAMP domain-containing histidine kinase [Prevotellaceae bacterium]
MLKIAHKIIFIYSAITLCAMGMAFAVLWYWMSDYADNLYYSFLEERAELIAQKNLERCSGNRVYDIYMEHRTDTVAKPVSTQIVLDADKTQATRRALLRFMSPGQIERLRDKGELKFKHGDNLGLAVYYPKPEGNFIVIVMLNRHLGEYLHRQMGYWLIGVTSLCILIVVLVSRLYTQRHIDTLHEAYQRERQFIHHASHELNNPLTAIQGECEIALMKKRDAADYEDSLNRIEQEAQRMSQTIKQLLYLSMAMNESDGESRELIIWKDFLNQFNDNERVHLNVSQGCDSCCITANPYLLKMAVGNIVRNALKYSSDDVDITLNEKSVVISDKGIGIPRQDIPYITQPFYRAANTRSFQGNGIGMSLAVNILKLYGIMVKIESEENAGTTIIMRLAHGNFASATDNGSK